MNPKLVNQQGKRLVRSEEGGDYGDPNAGISEELRNTAQFYAFLRLWRFRCPIYCFSNDNPSRDDFLLVDTGAGLQAVFIRVTIEDEEEEGVGAMPGRLLDTAAELEAQPNLLRVHLRQQGDQVKEELFGFEELEREWTAGAWWRRKLLRGRTARECLRLVGGQVSRLNLQVRKEPGPLPPDGAPGGVGLELQIEPSPRTVLGGQLDLRRLVEAAHRSHGFHLFSGNEPLDRFYCIPGLVDVVHEDDLVVWGLRGTLPRRLVVFERSQYREEIFRKVRRVLELHRQGPPGTLLGAGQERTRVAQALFEAEES